MSTQPVTILLVDDHHANILALEELLEKPERTFVHASSGTEALKLAISQTFDLVILDVKMPDMDGFEVAQVLKSNKKTKDIPVIFVSAARKEQKSILKGFEEGAIDYLLKPLDPDVTKAKVAVLLKVQAQQKELKEKNESLEKADEQIRKLNADLQKNLTQLEQINIELEAFSYSVSHDLRAPLRAINGYAEMLLDELEKNGHNNDENTRLTGSIRKNVDKMNNLISDLLEFSRMGKKEVVKTVVDMEKLVQQVIQEMEQSTVKSASIEINGLLPSPADQMLITQVWINLIGNALKYSRKNEKPTVKITCDELTDRMVYCVSDNGVGFDMKYADRLFGVFQRLHSGKEFEGTGIGLAIVQRIVNKHGGKVWADAKINEGAKFYFELSKK